MSRIDACVSAASLAASDVAANIRHAPTSASTVNARRLPRPIVTAATSAANSQLALSPTNRSSADPPLPNDRLRFDAPKAGGRALRGVCARHGVEARVLP